jgi:hypothetical protein
LARKSNAHSSRGTVPQRGLPASLGHCHADGDQRGVGNGKDLFTNGKRLHRCGCLEKITERRLLYLGAFAREAVKSPNFPAPGTLFGAFRRSPWTLVVFFVALWTPLTTSLVRRETPRLCRGGGKSLTAPAVCFSIQVPRPLALRLGACDFDFGSRQGPFEGPATRKASGSAGGYLLQKSILQEVIDS